MCNYVILLYVLALTAAKEQRRELVLTRQVGDKWYWGYADGPYPKRVQPSYQETLLTPTRLSVVKRQGINNETNDGNGNAEEVPSICLPSFEPPEKPDFSKPGRRISETKCYEYIWELNNRIEKNKRKEFCKKYKKLPPNKVVGGKEVPPGEFPHMGAIGWKAVVGTWVFKCGGSLISEKFVLTAAHCTKASPLDSTLADIIPKIVRLGDKTLLDYPVFVSNLRNVDKDISRIIVHPKYQSPIQYYDIALMELKTEVIFTAVAQPACLWRSFSATELGDRANVTGWGVVRSGSLRISPALRGAEVNVFEIDQCNKLLENAHNRKWGGVVEHQICAGNLEGGADSCQGDSGGPLQVKLPIPKNASDLEGCMHYVIGIISFGIDCGLPNVPGVYTRVSSFIDWIEEIVWNNKIN